MEITNISTAETSLSKLIEKVQLGEEVIIGKAGKPIAVLVPYETYSSPRKPGGSWEGQVWMADDFDETPQEVIAMSNEQLTMNTSATLSAGN